MNEGIELNGTIIDPSTGEAFPTGTEVQLLLFNLMGENPNIEHHNNKDISEFSNPTPYEQKQEELDELYAPSGEDGRRQWPDDY